MTPDPVPGAPRPGASGRRPTSAADSADAAGEEPRRTYDVPVVELRSDRSTIGHPWVFSRAIRRPERRIPSGSEVVVVASDGEPVGRGFYHDQSMIAVRILTRDVDEVLGRLFLRDRLLRALSLRLDVLKLDRTGDAFRLVNSEGDGLSGLVIDRYGGLLVVQYYSRGFFERRRELLSVLEELFPDTRTIERVDPAAARHEGIDLSARDNVEVEVLEGKMRFLVDTAGHKTGFFLDQRENRRLFSEFVRGKKVLDAFCYTGGFSIAARTLGRASRVVGVDLDEAAIAQARRNAALNKASIEWVHADCFEYLRNQRHAAEPFDAIVVDPPKWAPSRDQLETAERRYLDINTYAMRAVRRGGLLLTCSCSGLVSEEKFLRTVRHAAERADRDLQIFRLGGASPDHPVSVHSPEGRYLKALFARVY